MAFDPNQPFEEVEEVGFDPNLPFELVEEPDQPFFAVEDVVSAIGTIPEALATGVPAAFQKLVTGTAMPEESEAIEKDIAFQERMRQEQQDRQAAGKSSMVGEAIREAAPSIATSFGGLGAGIAGAVGGTVVGGPVGATVGGMAASGTASYRMAAADLLYRSFKALEEQKGSPLTEEEKAQAYKEFLPLAQNSALWEAGPEAVSNAVLLGAGKFVFGFGKPLARKLVGESIERVNKGIASKVAAGTGAVAAELGTETITALGQFAPEMAAQKYVRTGTTEGAPTEYPGGAMQAFKDVAPATLALTGMMAGAGGVAKAATLPFQKAKTPEQIEEDNINLDAEREADNLLIPNTDEESKSIKSQIDSERADLATKKELYNTLPDGDKAKAVLATEIKEYEGRITELDNTLRQRLGLSLPITTAEQQQIELAKQIAAPAKKEAKLPAMPSIEEQTSEAAYGRETGVYDVFGGVRRKPAQPVEEAPAITPAPVEEVAIPVSDKKDWVIKATKEGLVPDKITFQELRDEAFNYGAMDGDWLGGLEPQGNKGDLPARQDIEDVFGRKFTDEEFAIIQQEYVNGVNEMEVMPTPQSSAPAPAPVEEVEFAELRNLMERRGQAQGKVKGVKFSKKDEARYNELLPKYRSQLLETITPETDPVVWKDIDGNDIKVSQKGTFYTVENGRVRTGPAFQSEGFIKDVSPQPVSAAVVESNNVPLPEGYTKQGDLYVYQPTPAVSETITPAPEVAPEEALNRMDKIAEIKAQWKAELDAMPANNKNQRALRSSFIEYIWNQKSSLDELERIAADQFFKERSKTKELGKLQEDIDAENNEKVDFDNARQLVESLTGETGDAIRALVNTSPKLTSALEKIKVESGSPSFDGSVIRIRRTNNTPQTKAHEVTHAILDKAIDEVPTFRTDIAKIIKEFFRVGDWNANIYGDLSKEVRQKMEIVSRIYRQAITGYGSFGKSQDISFSRYFSSNLAFLVKTIQPSLRGYKITDQDVRFVYALTGEHEFLAAIMSDQEFRDLAKELKLYQKPKSLFDRFIEAIKSLFGKKPIQGPVTQLDKVMNLVEDVINNEAYQPGPYKRYYGRSFAPQEKPAEEKITDPVTPDEQTQQLVQQAQEQESLVDSAVKEAGTTVFDVFNRLVNEGKTEDQVAKELGISNYDVRKYKLRADTAILNKMKQNKVKPLAFAPKNPVAEFAEKNLRKYFTKEGWLPKAVFQSWVKRNAVLSREQKEAEFAIKDLYAGIREVFGISKMEMIAKGLVSVPPEFVQQLNDALAGKIDINTMPEPVREPLVRMRQHIDSMSRQLVDLNVLPDEFAAKVTSNLKVYLTRSYKIFTDKNWINKIPTEKLTAARNFLYQQQLKNDPEATIEMADRELRNMLNDWASDAEGLRKRGGKLGAKDLSVMMKRAEVPKVLRDVMGENTNVIFNYANTIGKISRFVADQKFLNEVKAKGAGEFLFTEKDAPKGFNTQIAAEESRTMSPLNGLRTTPEIAKAFEEFGKGYDIRENPGLRLLAWMNAVGKLNLTVGSVLTQMRNLLGQPAFFVFNGHYNWKVIRQEIDAIAKEMGISQEEAKRELVKQAAGQGLVNENAYAGELRTAFQDVGLETFDDIGPDEFTKQFVLTRMYLKGVKSAQELYQKTDEFGKLVGWLNETKRIQRMNKGMDKKTAQSIAAERTRDTYPTYSQSSEALRLFRRQPFVGPFATFFYETFRTSFHNLRYAFEDINGPTPEHKAEGIKRLAGAMATISMGAFGINLLSKLASGIGDEEEEDVRRMLPPWSKDASLAWMPKSKDGTYNFINVSYINPYNALTDPFIAMMSGFARGEKPEEIAVQALGSFLSPFTSEQPITATIADAARNRTSTGKQIYNPQDDIATKTSKIMLHIFGKTFTPGTITRLRERIIPAIQGETVGTRAPAPAKEIAAELTGIRFETLDMKSAFSSKAWEFSRAANESERIFRDVATRRRRVDEQEQVDAYRRSEETRYEIWNDMYRDYMAVRRAGASQGEAVRLMTDIGISKKEAIAISKGRYVPYEISNEVLRRSKLNGNVVPVKQIRAIGKEMPRVLNDIPKTP